MSKPNWTPDQRRAVDARGNTIVSAAAGAGKTAVLTERLTDIVSSGTPVDNLLVLTFTRAAAAEMKQRMEKKLHDRAAAETDAAKQAYLNAQAMAVGRSYISTIDAFCARILRRHGHLLDLPSSVRVLDELEAPVLMERIKDRLLTECGANEDENWKALLVAFRSEDAAWGAVSDVYTFLQSQPDPMGWLETAVNRYSDPAWLDGALTDVTIAAQLQLKRSLEALQDVRDTLPPSFAGPIGVIDGDLLSLRGALIQKDYDAFRQALSAYVPQTMRFPRGTEPEEKADVQAARDAVKKCVKEILLQLFRPADEERAVMVRAGRVLSALQTIVLRFDALFTEEKRRIGAMDYADLEHMALKVLQNADVAREYRDRFAYIAVDEYQDSNRVQESLLEAIRREDNLFFVGDVKQSIYRFRQAEPSLFLEKLTAFDGTIGERIDLSHNFRSAPEVLEATNDVFEAILHRDTGEMDYDARARLVPARELSGSAELHIIERGETVEEADETELEDALDAEVEARLVANRIRELMQSGSAIDRGGKSRPFRFSDFAILMRTATEAATFAAALAKEGIPCYAQMSGGYFQSVEVLLALDLLRVIDNRRQDIPLIAVLRGVLGFTAEDLVKIRTKTREGMFFEAFFAAADGDDALSVKCKSALDTIERFRKESLLMPLDRFLTHLFDETGLYTAMGACAGGAMRQGNLDALIARARTFEQGLERGISSFLRFMEHADESRAKIGTAQQVRADVVRILTIHRSKGLEFPVVFVCQLGRRFNMEDQKRNLVLHGGAGIGIRFIEDGVQRDTAARRSILQRQKNEQLAEEMRVLYVGMTRAEQHLILVGSWRNADKLLDSAAITPSDAEILSANAPLKWVLMGTRKHCKTALHRREEYLFAAAAASERRQARAIEPDPAGAKAIEQRLDWVYPFPWLAQPAKSGVTALLHESGEEIEFLVPSFSTEAEALPRITATERGSAIHKVLETLPLKAHTTADIFLHCDALISDGILNRVQADSVPKKAIAWLTSTPLYQRMCASARLERELPFSHLVSADRLYGEGSGANVLLQGVIDACFIEDGAWILLDFKSDRVRDGVSTAEMAKKHAPQLTLYAEALTALTGLPVKERYIVLLSAEAIERV